MLVVFAALPGLGCSTGSAADGPERGTVEHVGELPERFVIEGGTSAPTTTTTATTARTATTTPAGGAAPSTSAAAEARVARTTRGRDSSGSRRRFGDAAWGNRLLVIGDSISAAIGPEFGGQLCADLGRRGWDVVVDAQQGRDIATGVQVLEQRLAEGEWDAAIVNLGSNYRDDAAAAAADLERMLDLLRRRPVIVVTVSEWEERIAEVNDVIRDLTREREDVWVLEWSERTRADDSLTGDDGLHLNDSGREMLAALLSNLAGRAPGDAPPTRDCRRDVGAEPGELGAGDGEGADAGQGDAGDGEGDEGAGTGGGDDGAQGDQGGVGREGG